jgi:hypothetical protein
LNGIAITNAKPNIGGEPASNPEESKPLRTSIRTVTFTRSFLLSGFDAPEPPGSYTVETDEEPVEGLSFAIRRRISTSIRLPSRSRGLAVVQIVPIDPGELELALQRDLTPDVTATPQPGVGAARLPSTPHPEAGKVPAAAGDPPCR